MSDDDLARLKALPPHRNEHDPAPKARDAFERAFGRRHAIASEVVVQADGSLVARSVVPVLLAGVIVIYLSWVLSTVVALQG